ncbi:MAG: translesion error-prone DNA polymerase V autoproteolytic subunit [Ferruginibacter sp.]
MTDIVFLNDINPGRLVMPFFDGPVSAGFPSPAADYMQEEIDLNLYLRPRPSATFIIRVKGDSMTGAFIPDGALLVIDRSVKPSDNKIILAVLNSELVLKRFVKTSSGIKLMAANPLYAPIIVKDDMDFRVWGTVTQIIINALTV